MMFMPHAIRPVVVRPYMAARTVPPIRSKWSAAAPYALAVAVLAFPVIAGLTLRALIFVPF